MKVSVNKIVIDGVYGKLIFERCREHSVDQPHFSVSVVCDDEKVSSIGCVDTKDLIELGRLMEKLSKE